MPEPGSTPAPGSAGPARDFTPSADPNPTIIVRRRVNAAASVDQARLSDTLYAELRGIAGAYMARERGDHLLQPTALVNEAYIRLLGGGASGSPTSQHGPAQGPSTPAGEVNAPRPVVSPNDRTHFRAALAIAMKRVLVDHARARDARKRSPDKSRGAHQVELHEDAIAGTRHDDDVLAVDEAVKKLAALSERQARLVELRFFAGYTVEDAADLLGVSRQTCEADWRMARAWLKRELSGHDTPTDAPDGSHDSASGGPGATPGPSPGARPP